MSNTIPDDVMRAAEACLPDRVLWFRSLLTDNIAAAILAERQRCAGVAKEHHVAHTPGFDTYDCDVSQAILNPPSSRSSSPETTPDELAPSQASPVAHSDWITWNGGECPLPHGKDSHCQVLFRSGMKITDSFPEDWSWRHSGSNGDIIAYRVIPANLTQHEASL